jgi:hypothetical protein
MRSRGTIYPKLLPPLRIAGKDDGPIQHQHTRIPPPLFRLPAFCALAMPATAAIERQ